MNAEIGSGLQAQGPPATTSGERPVRSLERTGSPARSSMLRMAVKLSSYCSVKPMKSKSVTASRLSSPKRGIRCSRISRSRSSPGANTRSHQISSRSFISE